MNPEINPGVAVVGPGAIGTTIAAALHEVGRTPLLCGRSPRDHLTLQDGDRFITVPGPVRTNPTHIARTADLVFLAVIWSGGQFRRCDRDTLKARVRAGELKLLLGTDAASEGLNLQRLGTLINIDLPWNPTRLEQRKGRIQRIGQVRSEVWIANLRYLGSVEDRVHEVLADRLESIHQLFGQIPDTLEDVWVKIALQSEQEALQLIDRTAATQNPFDAKYSVVEDADWETCAVVVDPMAVREQLSRGW